MVEILLPCKHVIGMRVNCTSYEAATEQVLQWATETTSRYVCVANVHMTMEAHDDADFRQVVNGADLVTPDGMPLVWVLQALGEKKQKRVDGPNWMLYLCREAAAHNIPVAFYGSVPDTLQRLIVNLKSQFPSLAVVFAHAPPFRPLDIEEDEEIIHRLNSSGAKIIFVGLGCPKQERWMSQHKGRLMAVMIGVGAAFDFHAGMLNRAPPWMQRMGLEWLFRLFQEPRRMWRRYAKHNPRFIFLAITQVLAVLMSGRKES